MSWKRVQKKSCKRVWVWPSSSYCKAVSTYVTKTWGNYCNYERKGKMFNRIHDVELVQMCTDVTKSWRLRKKNTSFHLQPHVERGLFAIAVQKSWIIYFHLSRRSKRLNKASGAIIRLLQSLLTGTKSKTHTVCGTHTQLYSSIH